jgi:biopolymer transport protein ExbD
MSRTARSPAPSAVASEINVTPMIDVLLVVLIIYIVISMWRHVLPVTTPPPAPAGEIAATGLQLVLHIDGDGGLTLNGQPVPTAALDEHLESVYRDRPARLLFIAADAAVPYHSVIATMDRARGAGVEVLAFLPGQ